MTKTTKRALLSSALALFLCCAMLIGTTFAWFTDKVESKNNIIKSGNLDITLEYWNGTKWADVQDKEDILTNELWEPGVTEVAYFRIKNAGSLALKYQFGVNIVKETPGVNVAGESFKLSDYIYFNMIEGVNGETNAYATREDAMKVATEETKISAGYAKADTLKAGSDYVYLAMVVHMPTTVGNVANHNGTDVPKIDLGIKIMATQVEAEFDSFGPDYDKDVVYADVIVTNEAELKEALANANNGAVIGIKGNVTWTTGSGIGSTPFVESASAAAPYVLNVASGAEKTPASYITLVGLTEDATFTAIGSGVGAIGIDNGTVIFKDLKIVDESVSYAENSWEFGYLEFRGNTVFENCDIASAIMMEGTSATFENCTFNSNKKSEYAVWVSDGKVSFEDCYFTGTRAIKIHEAYGSEVVSVAVNNSTFADLSEKPGIAIGDLNAETTVIVKNNIFAGTQAGDQGYYSYETDTDVSKFDFVCDEENNTVITDVKVIDTAEELLALGGKNLEGTYAITADIDLAGAAMPTIGAAYGKTLTIIGNGCVISNATTAHTTHNGMKHHGFFYAYTNSTLNISDLTFDNIVIDATKDATRNYGAGIVVAYADGGSTVNLNNVDVKNSKVLNSTPDIGDEAGVYVGYQTGTLNMVNCDSVNCEVAGETVEKTGAFIGMVNGKAYLTNCTTDLKIGYCNRIGGTLVFDGKTVVLSASTLDSALASGKDVVLSGNLKFSSSETTANSGYGATGVSVKGGVLDGNGYSLGINNWGTWDSAVHTTGGTIKNLTINSGMRGIFMGSATADVYIDNVVIDGTIYTFNSDGGSKDYGVYISNSTLNGWTSHSDVHKEVVYTNCNFGEGNGYAFCRPYGPTTFKNCAFEAGFEVDARGAVTFENCTIGGVALTAENLATLVTSNTANATVK